MASVGATSVWGYFSFGLGSPRQGTVLLWGLLTGRHRSKSFSWTPGCSPSKAAVLYHRELSCITAGLTRVPCSLPGSRAALLRDLGTCESSSPAHTQLSLFQMHTGRIDPSIRIFCFLYFSHTFVIVHFPWKKRLRGKYIISFPLKSDSTSLTNKDFFECAHYRCWKKEFHYILQTAQISKAGKSTTVSYCLWNEKNDTVTISQ